MKDKYPQVEDRCVILGTFPDFVMRHDYFPAKRLYTCPKNMHFFSLDICISPAWISEYTRYPTTLKGPAHNKQMFRDFPYFFCPQKWTRHPIFT